MRIEQDAELQATNENSRMPSTEGEEAGKQSIKTHEPQTEQYWADQARPSQVIGHFQVQGPTRYTSIRSANTHWHSTFRCQKESSIPISSSGTKQGQASAIHLKTGRRTGRSVPKINGVDVDVNVNVNVNAASGPHRGDLPPLSMNLNVGTANGNCTSK